MATIKVVFRQRASELYKDVIAEEVDGSNDSIWLLIYRMENGAKGGQIARFNIDDIRWWEEE